MNVIAIKRPNGTVEVKESTGRHIGTLYAREAVSASSSGTTVTIVYPKAYEVYDCSDGKLNYLNRYYL